MDIRARTDLAEIVKALKSADFTEIYNHQITVTMPSGTDWRVYAKQSDDIMRIAYVSDACEMVAKDSFVSDSSASRQQLLNDMLEKYSAHRAEADRITGQHNAFTTNAYSALVGMVPAVILFKFPGLLVGVGAGVAGNMAVKSLRTASEDKKFTNYLQTRKLYIGDDAFKYITQFGSKKELFGKTEVNT